MCFYASALVMSHRGGVGGGEGGGWNLETATRQMYVLFGTLWNHGVGRVTVRFPFSLDLFVGSSDDPPTTHAMGISKHKHKPGFIKCF